MAGIFSGFFSGKSGADTDKGSVLVHLDDELRRVLDDVIEHSGADSYASALRYAALAGVLPWHGSAKDIGGTGKKDGGKSKRETPEQRTARIRTDLERLITDNQSDGGQTVLMRVTGDERAALGASDVPVKPWQRAITERVIRDRTGVNQQVAAAFIEQHAALIEQHNQWLFDKCGWAATDAHAFNRRTMAAARRAAGLGLDGGDNEQQ